MNPFQPENRVSSARSAFVTRVAWYTILVYAFATLNLAVYAFVPPPAVPPIATPKTDLAELIDWLRGSLDPSGALPPAALPRVPRFGMLIAFAVNVATLVAAAGLLHRRAWARSVFIGVLVMSVVEGAAWLILGLVPWPHALWGLGLIASALLCGWITAKLLSAPIREEFVVSGGRAS